MKKWINLLKLGLLLCLSVILVGCNDDSTTKKKTDITSNKTTSLTTDRKTTNNNTTNKTTSNNTSTTKTDKTTKKTKTTESNIITYKEEDEVKTYLLSVFNNDSAAGVTTTFYRKKVRENESVTITTKVNDGYYFVGWNDTATNKIVSTDPNYTFNMPSNNLSLEATYSFITLTLVNSEDSGNITTNYVNKKVSPGASVTIKCEPHNGVKFNGWYDYTTDKLVSMKAEYTFNMPSKNTKYVAKYDYAKLHLQMESYYNGTHYENPLNPGTTQSGELIYKCQIGDVVPVNVRRSSNSSPSLIGLFDENDNLLSADYGDYSIEIEITGKDVYVVAKWQQEFAIDHGYYNTSTLSSTTTILYKEKTDSEFSEITGKMWFRVGATYVLSAPDVEGYEFKGWGDTYLHIQGTDHEIEFEMPSNEHSLYPIYEKTITIIGQNGESYSDLHCNIQFKPYDYNDGAYEDINEDGTFTIRMGETYDLRVSSVDEGYSFNAWLNSEGTSTLSTNTTLQITESVSIDSYKISCTQTT